MDKFDAERAADAREERIELVEQMAGALRLMLADYRSEGCPDPDCGVCQRSHAAEAAAREALAAYEGGTKR